MSRIRNLLGWIFANFGPLIVFLVVKRAAGLKPAIVATVAWSIAELAYVVGWKRQKPTHFFYFSVGTTLAFGAVDLYSANPVLFRYEAVLTNILTGLYFGATVFVGKPLIQEFAEKARTEKIDTPGARLYLRYLTIAWSAYFFVKAAAYWYLAASTLSFEKATAVRSVAGPVSFLVMLGGERLFRPWLVGSLKAVGLLPVTSDEEAAANP